MQKMLTTLSLIFSLLFVISCDQGPAETPAGTTTKTTKTTKTTTEKNSGCETCTKAQADKENGAWCDGCKVGHAHGNKTKCKSCFKAMTDVNGAWCDGCKVGYREAEKTKCKGCYTAMVNTDGGWCDGCKVGYVVGVKTKCKGCVNAARGGKSCKDCAAKPK